MQRKVVDPLSEVWGEQWWKTPGSQSIIHFGFFLIFWGLSISSVEEEEEGITEKFVRGGNIFTRLRAAKVDI